MTKSVDVYGIGGSFVDVQLNLADESFDSLGVHVVRGGAVITDSDTIRSTLQLLKASPDRYSAGGSVANSLSLVAQLGGSAAFAGLAGNDQQGQLFLSEFEKVQVKMGPPLIVGGATGTVIVLISANAERSMLVDPGLNSQINPSIIDKSTLAASRWLYLEGQLPFYGANSGEAAIQAIKLARQSSCSVAVSLGPYAMDTSNKTTLEGVFQNVDLVFADEREAKSFTNCTDDHAAFLALCNKFPGVVVTRGEKGALVQYNRERREVAAVPCQAIDKTGAGDAFAGTLLYAISNGNSLDEAVRGASYIAMKVVTQAGARLQSGAQEYWRLAMQH